MTHWLDKLWLISDSRSIDLKQMATMLDADPRTFYRGQDLTSCDLRGQDLSEMDLTGCNIEKALIDSATKISPIFDPRVFAVSDYIAISISRDMNKLIHDYADEAGHTYPAWAFKALIDYGISVHRRKRWSFYAGIIQSNKYFDALLDHRSRSSMLKKTLQVHHWQQKYLSNEMGFGLDEKRFAWVLFVGLLSKKIPFADNRDYSMITPNGLVKRRTTGAVISGSA